MTVTKHDESWKTPLLLIFCGLGIALAVGIALAQIPVPTRSYQKCEAIGAVYAFQRDGWIICRRQDGTLMTP